VGLKAAETADSEREELRRRISAEGVSRRRAAGLAAHRAARYRQHSHDIRGIAREDELPVRERLLARLDAEFPSWAHSLGMAPSGSTIGCAPA